MQTSSRTLSALVVLLFLFLAPTSCSKDDACAGIVCQNGGTCISGNCECPLGFEGSFCETQKVPVRMFIEELEITKFPAFEPDGGTWDLITNTEPDLTFEVAKDGQASFYSHAEFFPDATPGNKYVFDDLSIQLDSPSTQRYAIILYDSDTDADDLMGGVVFLPYSPSNGLMTEFDLDAGGVVSFKIKVRYDF